MVLINVMVKIINGSSMYPHIVTVYNVFVFEVNIRINITTHTPIFFFEGGVEFSNSMNVINPICVPQAAQSVSR